MFYSTMYMYRYYFDIRSLQVLFRKHDGTSGHCKEARLILFAYNFICILIFVGLFVGLLQSNKY